MKIIKSILIIIAAFIINSCEEFIDLQPLDKIGMLDYWKTSKDLDNYIKQFYPVCFTGTIMVNTAENSDDMVRGSASDILNGERTTRTGNWRNEWSNIRGINIFFENYKRCESSFNDYKHYLGEAHFLRAWLYFELVKMYGDLPWYSKPIDLNSEVELTKPRVSRTLIIDSILVDLDKSALYVDKRSVVGNNRINKEAALAFKTRVALYEATWQKYHANSVFGTAGTEPNKYFRQCIEAAEELMNGSYKVGLYNTGKPEIDYYKLFGFDDMSEINEVLLYKAFSATDDFRNDAQTATTHHSLEKGVTWDLVSSYLGKNGQPYDFKGLALTTKGNAFLSQIAEDCDTRLNSTIWIPGDLMAASSGKIFVKPSIDMGTNQLCPTGFQVKKSANPYSQAAGVTWETYPGETGLILFRYAEVMLNYAEAKYELDNTIAFTQLNMLRQRVGMPNFIVNSQSMDFNHVNYGYTISDELYEIRRERRIELALEGSRDEDFMRWAAHSLFKGKRPLGYPFNPAEFPKFSAKLNDEGLIDYYKTELPNGYEFRENQDYLNSIPQDELILNPALTQNPGW